MIEKLKIKIFLLCASQFIKEDSGAGTELGEKWQSFCFLWAQKWVFNILAWEFLRLRWTDSRGRTVTHHVKRSLSVLRSGAMERRSPKVVTFSFLSAHVRSVQAHGWAGWAPPPGWESGDMPASRPLHPGSLHQKRGAASGTGLWVLTGPINHVGDRHPISSIFSGQPHEQRRVWLFGAGLVLCCSLSAPSPPNTHTLHQSFDFRLSRSRSGGTSKIQILASGQVDARLTT